MDAIARGPLVRTARRSTSSTAPSSPPSRGAYLTLGSWADRGARRRATTPDSRSTTARSATAPRTGSPTHDYLWRWDTDWFWCSRAFGVAAPAGAPALARPATAAPTSTGGSSPSTERHGIIEPDRPADAGGRGVEPSSRTSRSPSTASPSSSTSSTASRHRRRSGSARCGCATPGHDRVAAVPARAGTTYVNVGFWSDVLLQPGWRATTTTGSSRTRSTDSTGTSRCTRRRSTTARSSTPSTTGQPTAALKARYDPRAGYWTSTPNASTG